MNRFHQKAIDLKYNGKSYAQISEALSGELSEGTLKQYFATGGLLNRQYIEYEKEMNQTQIASARATLQRGSLLASQALLDGLQRAIESKNESYVLKYATALLDRTEIGDRAYKARKHTNAETMTYEEYLELCKAYNINPETGLRNSS